MQLRDYQEAAVTAIFDFFASGKAGHPIVAMPTGCHAKDSRILMYDGTVKLVQDITVGDVLMGPDSKPRTVLSLARGREPMAKIIPTKGESFIVNVGHILSLKTTQEKGVETHQQGRLVKGTINNISVTDYLNKSKWFKHTRKLWRPSTITFSKSRNFVIAPYHMGLLLGDGGISKSVSITTMDSEIKQEAYRLAGQFSLGVIENTKPNNKAVSYVITAGKATNGKGRRKNDLINVIRALGLRERTSENKFIPIAYKTASIEQRMEILAGLIDTDGALSCGGYDFISKSKQLADDVAFIARSLGLAAYVKECQKGSQTGSIGTYHRVTISGDCWRVPVRLERKKAGPRLQKKSVLATGFAVELLPEDDFYGFALSGDHLYLTDDFTVHHNTGKSVVIAGFVHRVFALYPNSRIMKLTHVKELIAQNLDKLLAFWPTAPAGVYSAGLSRKDLHAPIIFGGVATVAKAVKDAFGRIDLLLIDECDLVSPNEKSMYRKVIATLQRANPYLRIIGFTATPYRTGQGMLTNEGGIFTDICFDLTTLECFNWLLDQGYLAPLTPKRTDVEIDLSGVHTVAGEFNQNELQDASNRDDITRAAIAESMALGADREHWLVFATGIEHTVRVCELLNCAGVSATCVHSEMSDEDRDRNIADFIAGKYRAMVNNGILTTGFDFPGIDMIIMLRATKSARLWVQMLGRGTRPVFAPGYDLSEQSGRLAAMAASGKCDTLVLDFARNTERLGPINDPLLPRQKGKGGPSIAPVVCCPICSTYSHASVRYCVKCGHEFIRMTKLVTQAGTQELISRDKKKKEAEEVVTAVFAVDRLTYQEHRKEGKPPSIQVNYYCGLRMFREWVCLEHGDFAGKKARDWWRGHVLDPTAPVPQTTEEGISRLPELQTPTHIRVWLKSTYATIIAHDYTGSAFGENLS